MLLNEPEQHRKQDDDRDDDGFESVTEESRYRSGGEKIRMSTFSNCAAKVRHADVRVVACSSFGPYVVSRCAASVPERPAGVVASRVRTSSTGDVCHVGTSEPVVTTPSPSSL